MEIFAYLISVACWSFVIYFLFKAMKKSSDEAFKQRVTYVLDEIEKRKNG